MVEGCYPKFGVPGLSHSKRVYRSWQAIAAELSQEHDSTRIIALAEELDAAILAQIIPRHSYGNPYARLRDCDWVHDLLSSTLQLTAADFGNVQLFDSSRRALKLVAHRGFQHEFLTYFNTVNNDDDCACGSAMNCRSRVAVTDVATDPVFGDGESRQVILRADVQSLQSTPLVDSSGNLVGVLSTHFRDRVTPTPDALAVLDALVSEYINTMPADPTPF
jgi:GAF domain-containing protein